MNNFKSPVHIIGSRSHQKSQLSELGVPRGWSQDSRN